MEEIYKKEICRLCANYGNCESKINIINEKRIITVKCENYAKI